MSAYELAKACRKDDIHVSIRTILQSTSIDQLAQEATICDGPGTSRATSLSGRKRKHIEDEKGPFHTSNWTTSRRNHRTFHPSSESLDPKAISKLDAASQVTDMQASFLYGSIVRPGSNVISFYETYKAEDMSIVRNAWHAIIRLEPVFCSRLEVVEGVGHIVYSPSKLPDWTESTVTKDAYLKILNTEPDGRLSDMSFEILNFNDEDQGDLSTIIWRSNHGLIDGYSANLIYQKLRRVINGEQITQSIPFAQVAAHLLDYERSMRPKHKSFWARQNLLYPDTTGTLLLPEPNTMYHQSQNRVATISLDSPLPDLVARARHLHISIASMYHAAWAVTLSAFTNSDTVRFGAVFSGRDIELEGVEETIGTLINTLPMTLVVDNGVSVEACLRGVFQSLIELGGVHRSQPEDGFSRDFDSILSMQFSMRPSRSDNIALPVCEPNIQFVGDTPLAVYVWPDGRIRLDFHTNRFERSDMDNFATYFRNSLLLLSEHARDMSDVLARLMPPRAKSEVLMMSNIHSLQTHPQWIGDDLVTQFEQTSRENGSCVAVEKGGESLTYHRLDYLASHIASHLSDCVQPGDVVCVNADGSVNWIVAIYAILKAGAIYSAIDAKLPAVIRKDNFDIARAKVFLDTDKEPKVDGNTLYSKVLSVEALIAMPLLHKPVKEHRAIGMPLENAYICFTSGSSGRPKGVMCTHEGLLAFHSNEVTRFYSGPGCRIAQTMSPAFDGSIHEVFSALGWGSTLVLSHPEDPFTHLTSVDAAVMTPSIAKVLDPGDLPQLKRIHVVGEPLPQQVSDLWSSQKDLYNMYGPTEGTCGATTGRMKPGKRVTIGKPNTTMRLYVLDRHGRLAPPGVLGEIFLAGVQVAHGYVGRPNETAQKFLTDPFVGCGKQSMYSTGDRGRWNKLGEVECFGRNDRMIKLRGFRLDLTDLETRVLKGVVGALDAAFVLIDNSLFALIQPASLDLDTVLIKMKTALPHYAMPKQVLLVDDFPRTSIGKKDYIAIAKYASSRGSIAPFKRLQLSPTEELISGIWRDILGLQEDETISPDTAFTSLGGNSLLQLMQADHLRRTFHIDIPLLQVIEAKTLASLSSTIDVTLKNAKGVADLAQRAKEAQPLGKSTLSPLDVDWWHKYQVSPKSNASFTVAYAASLRSEFVDIELLVAAWNTALSRYDLLRSRHSHDASGSIRRSYSSAVPRASCVDHFELREEVNRSFDLAREPPVRVLVSPTAMLITLSHIICDYTGLHTLLTDLARAYDAKPLLANTRSFVDTTAWSLPVAASALDFWQRTLEKMPSAMFSERNSFSGTSRMFQLSHELCRRMSAFVRAHGVTFHQLVLGAVALMLTFDRQETDVVIGAPFLNRSEADKHVFGNFVTALPIFITYPLRNVSSSEQDGLSFVEAVQQSSQSSLAHALPFSHILEAVNPSRKAKPTVFNDPLIEVMVTMHDERSAPKLSQVGIPGARPLAVWGDGAKFKMMCEFFAFEHDVLTLRMEWDISVAGEVRDAQRRARLIELALEGLVADLDFCDLKSQLSDEYTRLSDAAREFKDTKDFFGSAMNCLE